MLDTLTANIEFVDFFPSLDAFVAVEVENGENTGRDAWASVSLRSRKVFEPSP
ncbi:hypothetical protein [Rubripirellula lacrimiformis]|uniref:hypothetical protein n=1 Tax=Rubripirellula lacrimiformis TaxID=1930273 RepID=UPI001C54C61A|nr:hypothetical protein [Rubripirellula lacrimiformis]